MPSTTSCRRRFSTGACPWVEVSCCDYPRGDETLSEAEEAMLALYCERAGLADGQDILELGCGWGSLTLWMAALTPAARRKGCQLFTSDTKLRLEIGGKTVFYYPDLLLSCDPQGTGAVFHARPLPGRGSGASESTARHRPARKAAGLPKPAQPANLPAAGADGPRRAVLAPTAGAWSMRSRAAAASTAWTWPAPGRGVRRLRART